MGQRWGLLAGAMEFYKVVKIGDGRISHRSLQSKIYDHEKRNNKQQGECDYIDDH